VILMQCALELRLWRAEGVVRVVGLGFRAFRLTVFSQRVPMGRKGRAGGGVTMQKNEMCE